AMLIREGEGLRDDPIRQDACEEEVGNDHDAPSAEAAAPLESGRNPWRGQADEPVLDAGEPATLLEQPRDLRHLSVGVRIGRTAPNYQDRRLGAKRPLEHRVDARL